MKLANYPGWSQVQDRRHNEHKDGQHDEPAPHAPFEFILSHLNISPDEGAVASSRL